MNKRFIGKAKENLAKNYLINNGYKIIESNFFTRFGEIDIIAKDDDIICFVEVKYRKNSNCGLGIEAVDIRKQQKIVSVAKYYVMLKGLKYDDKYRFDVVSIDDKKITLYKGAFNEENNFNR